MLINWCFDSKEPSLSNGRLELYNQQHTHQIDLYEPLTNALFVVTVKDPDTTQAVRALLASSPLSLAEKRDERATQANLANKCFSYTHRASNCFKLVRAAPRGRQSLYPEGGFQRREGRNIRGGSRGNNTSYERQEERRYIAGERGIQNIARTPLIGAQNNPISVTPGPPNGARVDISDPSLEEVTHLLARREIGVEHSEDTWKLALFQATHLQSTYLRDKRGKAAAISKGKRVVGDATSKDSSSETNSAEPIEEDSPIRFEGGTSGKPGGIPEATRAQVRREEEQAAYLKQQQHFGEEARRAQEEQKYEQEQAVRVW
ncbi:unnamed protein product [Calypogeia fissa]